MQQVRDAFRWTHELGIDTHAHMMLGMPGESKETIEQTIRFAKEIDPTTVSFGICTPYSGTPLFEEVLEKDSSIDDGSSLSKIQLHVDAYYNQYYTHLSNEELQKYVKKAYRRFYFRPNYLAKWLPRIKDKDELKRVVLAGVNVFSFSVEK